MNGEAPEITNHVSNGVAIIIPKEEWEAHKARVEALVNLVNGVINGMASNPMMQAVIPPDVLRMMRGSL